MSKYYGYEPDDIDVLIKEGFTPDEIEEYIYYMEQKVTKIQNMLRKKLQTIDFFKEKGYNMYIIFAEVRLCYTEKHTKSF